MSTEVLVPTITPVRPHHRIRARVRRTPISLLVGSFILGVYVIVALTGSHWIPYDPSAFGVGLPLGPATHDHLFGTDQLGRDVFSRVVAGAPIDLFLALTSTLVALVVGGVLGLLSGYLGGWFDEVLMRLFDGLISIPLLIFA